MTSSRRFVLSLVVAQLVALATLVRSVVFERWVTVLASVLLVVGAQAAARHRTWGVGLALAMAAAFPAAHLLGMAPAWFWGVGVAGALPFALSSRWMASFDRGATLVFAAVAMAAGVACAMAWHEIYPVLFAR